MPRVRVLDFMQNHRFWLLDVVPSAAYPFFVLGTPFLGFNAISTPEYTVDVEEIKELNSMFKKHVYSGGSVGPITLSRGVRGFDDSMWLWMKRALMGTEVTNRNLLLIHYTSIGSPLEREDNPVGEAFNYLEAVGAPLAAVNAVSFLPGKAWLLWDCIPTRYKAGSDFDAVGGEVSIMEMEIQPWAMTELTLMSPF